MMQGILYKTICRTFVMIWFLESFNIIKEKKTYQKQ